MGKIRRADLRKIKTVPLSGRKSKVQTALMGVPFKPGGSFRDFFWEGLPDVLAARDIREVALAIVRARARGAPVVLGMGAHPIKVGLSPVITDLVKKGIITSLAANGACIIHDFELAFAGRTSEDVAVELCKGTFGMSRETGAHLNRAISSGVRQGLGIGASVGKMISSGRFPHKDKSIFACAYELGVPATVHVCIGADIIHMHPSADGASIGEGAHRDFRLLAGVLSGLEGGVYINLGSAVLLPEVFLKALTVARNLGHKVERITTVDMDFTRHYRPAVNVLMRPTLKGGKSYSLTGHHEIMLPLLAAAICEAPVP